MLIGTRNLKEVSGGPVSTPATHVGQAHFALIDAPATCAKCEHHSVRQDLRNNKRFCFKAREISGKWLAAVPGDALACKYFAEKTQKDQ
jgi:hypothetical protein